MRAILTSIPQRDILHQGIPLPFRLEQTDGIFILIVLCFMMFVYIYQGSFKTIKSNLLLTFALGKANVNTRSYTSRDIWYSYYLILQFTIFVSITAYSIFNENTADITRNENPSITITLFILFISTFLILKSLLYKLTGYIFNIKQEMKAFEISQLFIIELLGIIYFIPTLLVVYSGYLHTTICIAMAIIFIIIEFIFFCQLAIFFVRKKFNFLYTIAYLCTMEIIPYLLLIFGIIYLYNNTEALTLLW